jgi:hypothetical protein
MRAARAAPLLLFLLFLAVGALGGNDDAVVNPALPVPGRPLVMSEHNTDDFYTTLGYEGAMYEDVCRDDASSSGTMLRGGGGCALSFFGLSERARNSKTYDPMLDLATCCGRRKRNGRFDTTNFSRINVSWTIPSFNISDDPYSSVRANFGFFRVVFWSYVHAFYFARICRHLYTS